MINLIILFSKRIGVYVKNNFERKNTILSQSKKFLIVQENFAAVF